VITMQEIFQFQKTGHAPDGRVLGMFRATGVRPKRDWYGAVLPARSR